MSNPAQISTGRSWLRHRRPFFIVWPLLLLGLLTSSLFSLAKTAVVRAAPPDCADSSWLVANESELNAAIGCFNGQTAGGSYAITLSQPISLTAATATINNGTAGATLLIDGSGTIVKTPAAPLYDHGTVVTLAATPDFGSTFTGWSGAGCSGTGSCVVTMDGGRNVTAIFTRYFLYLPVIQKGP